MTFLSKGVMRFIATADSTADMTYSSSFGGVGVPSFSAYFLLNMNLLTSLQMIDINMQLVVNLITVKSLSKSQSLILPLATRILNNNLIGNMWRKTFLHLSFISLKKGRLIFFSTYTFFSSTSKLGIFSWL